MCGIPHFINGHEAMTTAETPQIFHTMIIKYLSNTVVYLYLIQLDLANSNSLFRNLFHCEPFSLDLPVSQLLSVQLYYHFFSG